MIRVSGVVWFTNLEIEKRHEALILYKHYSPEKYPKYDNFDAINVTKTNEIPMDYDGLMGVPITFMSAYNPNQFEIIGSADNTEWLRPIGVKAMGQATIDKLRAQGNKAHVTANMNSLYITVDNKIELPYSRLIIKRKL